MSSFTGLLVVLLLIAGVGFAAWLFFTLLTAVLRGASNASSSTSSGDGAMTAEDESYAHSGPHGYSANTAYPQTQYGSGFNPDAEWNENRRDRHDHEEEW